MERERSVELCLFSCHRPFPRSRTSYFRFACFIFTTFPQSESLEQAITTTTSTPSSFKANYMVP